MAKKASKPKTKRKKARAPKSSSTAVRGTSHRHEDDSICACDLVFDDTENTADQQLPAARGGVEGELLKKRAA